MVAWYWLIVSACGGIVFAKICEEVFDWDNILTEFIAFFNFNRCIYSLCDLGCIL